ncbi:MAG: hypothetical protein IJ452_07420, partial [Butyricicoccus sp.]|nr:hypothetical protein [Butyricicoccus sp.]
IDGVPDALNAVKEGTMDVTIMQSAERQAECLYEAIKTAQAGGENPAVINPSLVTVDASNIDEYL